MPEIEFTAGQPLEWVLETAGPPPDDEPYTLQQAKLKPKLVEMEDVHFHLNSAVPLPDHQDCHEAADDEAAEDRLTGLGVVQHVLGAASENPESKLLVVGHTDTSGQDEYNLYLSDLRAKAVHALISGDRDTFAQVCTQRHQVEDYQRIFKWAAAEFGWDCDPGPVDNTDGPKTQAGSRGFHREYNEDFDGKLKANPTPDEETFGAIYDCYVAALARLLETDVESVAISQEALAFVEPGAIGAGETYPIESSRSGDYRAADNRRVEILLFGEDEAPAASGGEGDHGLSQVLYDPAQYEYEHLPCDPSTPPTLLRAYLELSYRDPEGTPQPFPKDFAFGIAYGSGKTKAVRTDEEGKVEFSVRRSGETFTLEFTGEKRSYLAQSAPAEEGGEPPPPVIVDSDALLNMAATTQYLGFPKEWSLETSKWTVEGADTYNTGSCSFEGLKDTATKIGKPDEPVKLILELRWDFYQFVFWDRQAKKLSACPLELELRGWMDGTQGEDLTDPDAHCRWAFGQSQTLAWVEEKGSSETLVSMHTEEGTFVKTAEDGTQTLEIGLQLDEANVERLAYYDLPEVWRSTGYWARLSAGSPDQAASKEGFWADMWDTGTADGTPMMFFLDDLVLTDETLTPIEWAADGVPENRLALFCNTFDDQGQGPAGATFDSRGLFNPDGASGCFSSDPTDVIDRNYIVSYPYWTRLVVTQGNLHSCFAERVPDGLGAPSGARAAVRWVDGPSLVAAKGPHPASATDNARNSTLPVVKTPFFAVEANYTQLIAHTYAASISKGQSSLPCREWTHPYQGPSGWGYAMGRVDLALLRCCDVVEDRERAVNLWYLRHHYDFESTAEGEWEPASDQSEAQREAFGKAGCENTVTRWNNAETKHGHPVSYEPAGEGVPLVVTPLMFMQFVPAPLAQYVIDVCKTKPGLRSNMHPYGMGKLTLEANSVGSDGTNTVAHENGHGSSLVDEYNELWTKFSFGWLSCSAWIPGDPYRADSTSMMNGNVKPRLRHYWHAAEWCRVAMDDVGLVIKRKAGGLSGPSEYTFQLPHHPWAPYRNYVNWPLFSTVKAGQGSYAGFQAYVYPLGDEALAYDLVRGNSERFDGVLCVQVNVRLRITAEDMPMPAADIRTLVGALNDSVTKTFNAKFVASGFKLGEIEFQRCLFEVSPRFRVENFPRDDDDYIGRQGAGDLQVPTNTQPSARSNFLENVLPPQWQSKIQEAEGYTPSDLFVHLDHEVASGQTDWADVALLAGVPTLHMSHGDTSDFYRWFGHVLGLDLPRVRWWQRLTGTRDGREMTERLTDKVLREISSDGSISKL